MFVYWQNSNHIIAAVNLA